MGIDDQVHSAQLQYCQACTALKSLQGPGNWEVNLKVLEKGDVYVLNKWELTVKEKDDIHKVQQCGGVPINEDELDDECVSLTNVTVGDGQQWPSWIWYQEENILDPCTHIGESSSNCIQTYLFTLFVTCSSPHQMGKS